MSHNTSTATIVMSNSTEKKIQDQSDLATFRYTEAYSKLHSNISYVVGLVRGVEVPTGALSPGVVTRRKLMTTKVSPQEIKNNEILKVNELPEIQLQSSSHIQIVKILDCLYQLLNEYPPEEGQRRFGNLAFRKWHDAVDQKLPTIVKDSGLHISEEYFHEAVYYLKASLGSPVRLDYGTGHELSFLAFLGYFLKSQISDGSVVLAIFGRYYDLVRSLIVHYLLEPAGSHGVWGLDDHFHLIYILGAAQYLNGGPPVKQTLILARTEGSNCKNLFINGLAFILCIKSGSFHEHSPMLNDIISTVYKWEKVVQGLLKMYDVEVFGKFPVVQHFWFGRFYPWRLIPQKALSSNAFPKESEISKSQFSNSRR